MKFISAKPCNLFTILVEISEILFEKEAALDKRHRNVY